MANAEESMSRVVGAVVQRLESDMEAVTAGTIAASARNTQVVVDGLHQEIKGQINQNRADLERKQVEMQGIVKKIAADLEELTRQLNSFKPTSESALGEVQGKISTEVSNKLSAIG